MAGEYIKVYYNWSEVTSTLSDAEKGRLITALVGYASNGEVPELSGAERHVFPLLRVQIDKDREKSIHRNIANRENGKKGGRPRKRPEISETQENPTKPTETQENPMGYFGLQENPFDSAEREREKRKEPKEKRERERVSPPSPSAGACAREDGSDASEASECSQPPEDPQVVYRMPKYCEQAGIKLTLNMYDEIRGFIDDGAEDDMMCFAVDEAVANGKAGFAYVRRCLDSWMKNGCRSLDDVKRFQERNRANGGGNGNGPRTQQIPRNVPAEPYQPQPRFFSEGWDKQ